MKHACSVPVFISTLFATLMMGACSFFEAAPEPVAVVVAPKRDLVAEIRQEAAKAGDVLVIDRKSVV